jgi:hypothetical protein
MLGPIGPRASWERVKAIANNCLKYMAEKQVPLTADSALKDYIFSVRAETTFTGYLRIQISMT